MLKVGITGGIGSGKSTVCQIFATLGIPVYQADDAAKRLMQENEALKQAITDLLGAESYVNGRLNRPYISQKVFHSPALLEKLNALVHPVTIADGQAWMSAQTTPYAIKEAALIFESGTQNELDFVIGVYAPKPVRIQRVMTRNQITREQVIERMQQQLEESIKMRLCDTVIVNDNQQALIPQVMALHEQFIQLKMQS